jgi:para-nitrobenzyl esterase
VVDGMALDRQPFAPDAPPTAADIPLVVGACADELTLFTVMAGEIDESLLDRLQLDPAARDRLLAAYRELHPDLSTSRLVARMLGDATFNQGAIRQAELKSAQPAGVYSYVFNYAPPIAEGKLGAFHTAELPLVFRLVAFEESEALSRTLAAAWAAFARTGDPSTPGLAWPRFDAESRRTMVFDLETKVVQDPERSERLLWDSLPPQSLRSVMGVG